MTPIERLREIAKLARIDVHAMRVVNGEMKKYVPVHRSLSNEDLRAHLDEGPYRGIYHIAEDSTETRLAGYDLDDHGGKLPWDIMATVAITIYGICVRYGLKPWLVRSGGGKGIHMWFHWEEAQTAKDVRVLLRMILAEAGYQDGKGGIEAKEVEVFPKQDKVAKKHFGNLMALPFGRKSVPLDAECQPVEKEMPWLPSDAVPVVESITTEELEDRGLADPDLDTVREALKYVEADDRDVRIKVGLALKRDFGDKALDVWTEWLEEKAEGKYDPDKVPKQWDGFNVNDPGVTLGTVYWLALQGNWPGMPPQQKEIWKPYIAFEDRMDLYDVNHSLWMQRANFNDLFARYKRKRHSPVQVFLEANPDCLYETVIWDPALPSGRAQMNGSCKWNTWIAPTDFGTKGNIEPWLRMMRNVYGRHTDVVMKRMAFDVQYPHRKPQWAVYMVGPHGIGKNTTVIPLRLFYGSAGRLVKGSDLKGSFNDFMACLKVIEIAEVETLDYRHANGLKEWVASSSDIILVNAKHLRQFWVRNAGSFWLSANRPDAFSIEEGERRFYVIIHEGAALSEKERVRTFEWVNKGGWKHVIWYLKNRVKVDENFGSVLPEHTADMKMVVQLAGTRPDRLREPIREATRDTSLFLMRQLHTHLFTEDAKDEKGYYPNVTMVTKAVVGMGGRQWQDGRQIKLDGKPERIWTFDPKLAKADPEEIRKIWDLLGCKFGRIDE